MEVEPAFANTCTNIEQEDVRSNGKQKDNLQLYSLESPARERTEIVPVCF